jgi:SAM-dependent methyltransferase
MAAPEPSLPRLYTDLAWLWPLWEDVEEYRAECDAYIRLYEKHTPFPVSTLLDLGCGGDKTSHNLARRFTTTGIDLSEAMLAHARKLNPEGEFVRGDMRSLDLERTFDAVFVNDAISYMTSLPDLVAVFRTARRHLKPQGVMLVNADMTRESFVQNRTDSSWRSREGLQATFIENYFDPDPEDTELEFVLTCIIRDRDGVRVEHDLHRLGIFSRKQWEEALNCAGFDLLDTECPPEIADEHPEVNLFVCSAS